MMNFEAIETAAQFVGERTGRDHEVAVILGSGLGPYADQVRPIRFRFRIPRFLVFRFPEWKVTAGNWWQRVSVGGTL